MSSSPSQSDRLSLPAGFRLDDYRIERLLGKGGFGLTYLAVDEKLDARVAIKELLPDGVAARFQGYTVGAQTQGLEETYQWTLRRFMEEARLLARLNHPSIVRVVRLMEAHGTAYMVMEYVEGESLSAWIKRLPSPSQSDLLGLMLPLLDGLDYIHEKGLLHRDIKPDNIIITPRAGPVLLDFGSARADLGRTAVATSMVSDGYSPREQYQQKARQGPFSDIYALGAVMVHAMTGAKPMGALDRWADPGLERPLSERVPRHYTAELVHTVQKAFAVAPEERWQSAAEMKGALAHPAPRAPSVVERAREPSQVSLGRQEGPAAGAPPAVMPPPEAAPPPPPKPPRPKDTRSSWPGWMCLLTLMFSGGIAGLFHGWGEWPGHLLELVIVGAFLAIPVLLGLGAWLSRRPWTAMVNFLCLMVASAFVLTELMDKRGWQIDSVWLEEHLIFAFYCAGAFLLFWGWLRTFVVLVKEHRPVWWKRIPARPTQVRQVKVLTILSLVLPAVSTVWAVAVGSLEQETLALWAGLFFAPAPFELVALWRGVPWAAIVVAVIASLAALWLCITCTLGFTAPGGPSLFTYGLLFHGVCSLLQIQGWSQAAMRLRRERHARMREDWDGRG